MKLLNKTAIVTGGGSGIGRGIALALAREGANVAVSGYANLDLTEKTARAIQRMGRRAIALKVDVRSYEQISKAIARTLHNFGRIDILVNNAGVSSLSPVVDMTEQDWDYNVDINAKGVFLFTKAVLKQMIKQGQGGRIINISSLAGKFGNKFYAHYSASKFAVIGFTKSVALEVAEHKITVNAVCPTHVETPMTDREVKWESKCLGVPESEVRKRFLATIPIGRFATPEDVANVVVFLASDESNFITGATIDVGGGQLIGA
mgnify:CR=1 FL=1